MQKSSLNPREVRTWKVGHATCSRNKESHTSFSRENIKLKMSTKANDTENIQGSLTHICVDTHKLTDSFTDGNTQPSQIFAG